MGAPGLTVRLAEFSYAAIVAVMLPTVVVDAAAVVMVKFADEEFGGIIPELGSDAAVLVLTATFHQLSAGKSGAAALKHHLEPRSRPKRVIKNSSETPAKSRWRRPTVIASPNDEDCL